MCREICRRSSSTKGRLSPKVTFHQRLSPTEGDTRNKQTQHTDKAIYMLPKNKDKL